MAQIEEKDLTGEDGDLSAESASRLEAPPPTLEPFNLTREQEKVRGRIAEGLLMMLGVILLFAFLTLWALGTNFGDLEKLMTIIFAPVITLVGTATGYYFGNKTAQPGAPGGGS
jgi:hypothetical protein